MSKDIYTKEYLQELRKLAESFGRLQLKLERHLNRGLSGKMQETVLLSRKEAIEFIGLSPRQFDRVAKQRHFWRYRNEDGTQLRFDKTDLTLTKDELKEKWVKGILAKQIDVNCNVIRQPSEIMKSKEGRLLQEKLKKLENEKY